MAIFSLRFPLSPCLLKTPTPNFTFTLFKFPILPPRPYCSSQTSTLLPPEKWEPFRKKKVVVRVGYVGTDYRGHFIFIYLIYIYKLSLHLIYPIHFYLSGLQKQRDENELSSKILHIFLKPMIFEFEIFFVCLLSSYFKRH